MATLTDAKFDALRSQGFVGSISDMKLQWLFANGAVSSHISDAWHEMLSLLNSSIGQVNDRWYRYLVDSGYGVPSKQINDMEKLFWESGGVIVPPAAPRGYSAGYGAGYG